MRYILKIGITCNTAEEADQLYDLLDARFPVTELCEGAFSLRSDENHVWLEGYADKNPVPDLNILEEEIKHLGFSATVDEVNRIYDSDESKN